MTKVALEAPAGEMARHGLNAVEFICPRCSGLQWGSYRDDGPAAHERGSCHTPTCAFTWPRDLDWLWFHRKADGQSFKSPEAFEIVIGVTGRVA